MHVLNVVYDTQIHKFFFMLSFDNYYLSKETYEWAFQTAGFEEIHLHQPIVFSEGIKEFDLEFFFGKTSLNMHLLFVLNAWSNITNLCVGKQTQPTHPATF